MFCQRCGKYNPDDKKACMYCGGALTKNSVYQNKAQAQYDVGHYQSKSAVGVLMCLFLGLLGLLIGCLIYSGYEKESFLRAWVKTFVITLIVGVVLVFVLTCTALAIAPPQGASL